MSQLEFSDSHFDVLLADTSESKRIHYKLRYQVYCDEKKFEDKKQFQDGIERDEWDNDATHFLVRHKFTGQYLGTLRLARSLQYKLPFEKHSSPYRRLNNKQYYSSVEISRLCVIKEARKFIPRSKTTECLQYAEIKSCNIHDYRPLNHELMWRMIRAAALYSYDIGLKEWYILVSPALDRKSTRLNSSHSDRSRMPSSA